VKPSKVPLSSAHNIREKKYKSVPTYNYSLTQTVLWLFSHSHEDDEETIEEDERAALEEDDVRLNLTAEEERNALEDEANIPIEELMRRYQANNRQFGKKEP